MWKYRLLFSKDLRDESLKCKAETRLLQMAGSGGEKVLQYQVGPDCVEDQDRGRFILDVQKKTGTDQDTSLKPLDSFQQGLQKPIGWLFFN